MNRVRFKITLVALTLTFVFSACRSNETSESFDILNFSDDTTEAAELVSEANENLNKIKVMYKQNEVHREELVNAMGEKDVEKVKRITDDLVYTINDGMRLGEEAVEKIGKARQKNINADFKEYLSLKEESLEKQLEAFENLRQAVRILRDSFGTNDPKQIEQGKNVFREKDESFVKTMAAAKEISKKANELAKESSKK
jgi:hypothetical protein